jgi:4-amino-4-deoxy-L-arabinose transferase-like glycosyltransferase
MIRFLWILVVIINLLRLAVTFHLPMTGDEAYYWEWSQHLAFGYVDHPPAVAWVGAAFAWLGRSPGISRLGFWLCGVITTLAAADAARRLALRQRRGGAYVDPEFAAVFSACFLTLAPLCSLAFTTISPDGPYLAAWACVIDAAIVVEEFPELWQSSVLLGVALGAALLARAFSAVLLIAVISGLVRYRKALFISCGVALLACAPWLLWNAEHQWINIVFTVAGRHVNEGLSLIRPLLTILPVIGALGLGPGVLAFGLAWKSRSRLLLVSTYALVALFLILSLFERVEIYWFLGPYISAGIATAVLLADAKWQARLRMMQWRAWSTGTVFTCLVLVIALFPFQILQLIESQTHQPLKRVGVFEIFTYRSLAQDVRRLTDQKHAVVMTDGYGLSSLLDYEAGIAPIVIGYDWQGREAREWVPASVSYPLALFVDKEPLANRPDFAKQLALACGTVNAGPDISEILPGLPPRIYSTTWCKDMQPGGIGILRWERPQ